MLYEQNHMPRVKMLGIWEDITKAKNMLVYNNENLMYNYTINATESFKFYLSWYELITICYAVVTTYDSEVNHLSLLNKHITSKIHGKFTKQNVKKYNLSKG